MFSRKTRRILQFQYFSWIYPTQKKNLNNQSGEFLVEIDQSNGITSNNEIRHSKTAVSVNDTFYLRQNELDFSHKTSLKIFLIRLDSIS